MKKEIPRSLKISIAKPLKTKGKVLYMAKYDENGNVIYGITHGECEVLSFYDRGNKILLREENYTIDKNRKSKLSETTFKYNRNRKLIEKNEYYESETTKTVFEYSKKGLLVKEIFTIGAKVERIVNYKYDKSGRSNKRIELNGSNEEICHSNFEYNNKGQLILETRYISGNVPKIEIIRKYKYNKNGKVDIERMKQFLYSEDLKNSKEFEYSTKYKYKGNLLIEEQYYNDKKGKLEDSAKFQYDFY